MTTTKLYGFCFISLVFLLPSQCAPRSKNSKSSAPHTVYDQKQTGDYNIQLHLKDFQIIALLADDAVSLGDYDYNYDYADFTVKPVTQKPTEPKPPESTSTAALTSSVTTSPTVKPSNSPSPNPAPSTTPEPPKEKPNNIEEKPLAAEQPPKEDLSNVVKKENTNSTKEVVSSTTTTQKSGKLDDTNSPGKIKVQIIETPVDIGIVPGEDINEQADSIPQGEIMQLRRCVTGFTRDKKGRCRRVRKPGTASPQLFGFSRLASNLASKFNKHVSDSSSSSESTED